MRPSAQGGPRGSSQCTGAETLLRGYKTVDGVHAAKGGELR
jgi:hypothetical protein